MKRGATAAIAAAVVLAVGLGTAIMAYVADGRDEMRSTSVPAEASTAASPEDLVIAALAATEEYAQRLIGLTPDEAVRTAVADGYEVRVISDDSGVPLVVTADMRAQRIDLSLRDGIVDEVSAG